jgi:phosphate transport system permease protein
MSKPATNPAHSEPASAIQRREACLTWLFRASAYAIILSVAFIFLSIAVRGAGVLLSTEFPFVNQTFFTQSPETLHVFTPREPGAMAEGSAQPIVLSDTDYAALALKPSLETYAYASYAHSAGGIGPAIVGTGLLVVGSICIAFLLGLPCAIYLSEYSPNSRGHRWIKLAVLNLAGVPSIVYGLFGFGLFVLFFNWGVSLMAGWFTLGLMAVPVVIAASEQALRDVPQSYREGALALGASKWKSIATCVLPSALPGILTSSILSIARVAGETAPILFTVAFAFRDQLPWQGLSHWTDFFFQGVMALPYHIFMLGSKVPQNEYTSDMQYGATLVFLLVIGAFVGVNVLLRAQSNKRLEP